jgi:hypothetical protein
METLLYILLAAVLYGIVAERSDRAVERTMRARQAPAGPQLVEEFDVRPDQPWYRRAFRRAAKRGFHGSSPREVRGSEGRRHADSRGT